MSVLAAPRPHCGNMALPLPAGGHPGPRLPRRGPGAVGQLPARPLFLGTHGDSRGPQCHWPAEEPPPVSSPTSPPDPPSTHPYSHSEERAQPLPGPGRGPAVFWMPHPGEAWTAKGRCGTQDAGGTEREATTHRGADWAWGSQTPKLTLDRLAPGKPLHIGGHFSCSQRGEEGDADQRQGASRALVCKTGGQRCQVETWTARPRPLSRGPESPGHTRHRGRRIHVRKRGAALLSSARNHSDPQRCGPCPGLSTVPGTQRAPNRCAETMNLLGAAWETRHFSLQPLTHHAVHGAFPAAPGTQQVLNKCACVQSTVLGVSVDGRESHSTPATWQNQGRMAVKGQHRTWAPGHSARSQIHRVPARHNAAGAGSPHCRGHRMETGTRTENRETWLAPQRAGAVGHAGHNMTRCFARVTDPGPTMPKGCPGQSSLQPRPHSPSPSSSRPRSALPSLLGRLSPASNDLSITRSLLSKDRSLGEQGSP